MNYLPRIAGRPLKRPRGRKKALDTQGYACPDADGRYFLNPNPAVQALVGYGHHGRHEPIQDVYCQVCRRYFSARRHTALYRLKAPAARIAQVLHAVAEGLSPRAAARVFKLSETTVLRGITRAGQHPRCLHDRFLRALPLTHVQLDELRLQLPGAADAAWLPLALRWPAGQTTGWVACDARTKLIPAFQLGPRTQALAHQLIHELAQRLTPDGLPVFWSDGLALYFYALTAHFGQWVEVLGQRRRRWTVDTRLLYAQLIKRYTCPNCEAGAGRCRRLAEVRQHVCLGPPAEYRQALCAHDLSGRIQTAFVERLNLTIRRSIAGLACRWWTLRAAHALSELALHFEWWRGYYHFARSGPHASLRQPMGENTARQTRQRFRQRSPAQAAGLTDHRWTVLKLLAYPAPPLKTG